MRKEFERVSPEEVGIPSASIEKLLDRLEEGWTEPHSLMIMKEGKVCAEGWWAPYAAGLHHGLQSHTKTYAATAIGIAYTEGILRLDERIIDIFPDKVPENPSENLKLMTVRDVLCMGCGMNAVSHDSEDWIRDFLATPVIHRPGTAFRYNSTGSTLLGAIVREKTGLGLIEYLKPRLFDKIGIDADNLKCMKMMDGMEIGGGGLFATTEDNLRLMKLYADGGIWEGERILSEDYVKMATSLQNESETERSVNPPAEDNFVGYGFQIWMCRPEGVYRADGAMGQFTIVFPKKNMVLAITETAMGSTGGEMPQKTLDTIWEWYDSLPDVSVLPENKLGAGHLVNRMRRLSLPAPDRSRSSNLQKQSEGEYDIYNGHFSFRQVNPFTRETLDQGYQKLEIHFTPSAVCFELKGPERQSHFIASMDGSRKENIVSGFADMALASAAWEEDNILLVTVRYIETCNSQFYRFVFNGQKAEVTIWGDNLLNRKTERVLLQKITH